ncbi:Proline dehydrogenase [Mycena indigotica]|uniref:Proline dehydrogenase n=1 Tax=Mycena indigotica TaxID=2126181 RepID=A0A8H6TCY6_9AGAR|nr:Proline dehydrogenase [Mycena indigotica]KAF7315195.1 Proline dehydrogenase [Mycena indigotica]
MLRLPRPRLRSTNPLGLRYASGSTYSPRRKLVLATGGVALGVAATLGFGSKLYLDAATVAIPAPPRRATEDADKPSFGTLLRTYVVYTMCSIPKLVDSAPWLLETCTSIPGLRWATEALVRATFFNQFVGGDSALETLPVLKALRQNNIGTLFAYSIEVDEAEAMSTAGSGSSPTSPHQAIVNEMLNCIDVAAEFEAQMGARKTGRRTWVAVKMATLLPDASALIRLSSHIIATRSPTPSPLVVFPGNPTASDLDLLYSPKSPKGQLSDNDLEMLRELHQNLEAICARAAAKGVRIILDAEYSWYEPAIDALSLALMRRFNAGPDGPLVYATYQAYLRRTHAHLVHALRDAKKHGYALGAKLVRGAYHPHEMAAHGTSALSISPDSLPPVWDAKADTDANYNACTELLLDAVDADVTRNSHTVGALFGTHNWTSSNKILAGLEQRGLGNKTSDGRLRVEERVGERVTFGQLYGMCDDLTQYLSQKIDSSAPMVIKYVPYGALVDVMPYLSRRAIENKSVLGDDNAQKERRRAWRLMVQRIFG